MRLIDDVAENRRLTRWADLLPRAPGQRGGVHEPDAELVPLGDGRLLALTVDTVCEEIRLGLYRDPRTAGRLAAAAALMVADRAANLKEGVEMARVSIDSGAARSKIDALKRLTHA